MPLNILDDINRLYPSAREISLGDGVERHSSSLQDYYSEEASRAIRGSSLIANCSAVLTMMSHPTCDVPDV